MKKMKASRLLVKAFLKYKRYWLYIMLTSFIAAFVSCGFWIFMNVSETLETDTNKMVYGSYNLKVSNLHGDMAFFISRESGVERAVPYREREIEQDGVKFSFINANKMYLDMSNVNLVEGTYPTETNQILLDRDYLLKQGVAEDSMIGSTFSLENEEYVVTGVTETNSEYELINPAVTIIGPNVSEQNAVLVKTSVDSAESFITYLDSVYRFRLGSAEYFINAESDVVKDSSEGETDFASILILFIVISLSSVVTITNCIKVLLLNAGRDIGVFRAIGVGNKYVFAAIRKIGATTILIANALVVVGSGIIKQVFMVIVANLKGMKLDEGETLSAGGISLPVIILIALAFVAVEVLALFVQTYFLSRKSTLDQLKNSKGLSFKNKLSNVYHKVGKNIIYTVASRNYRLTWKTNLFISISLILCMTLLSSMSYYLRLIEDAEVDYGQADYRVVFSDDITMREEERAERDEFVASLEEPIAGCVVNPIYEYVSSGRVEKAELSEEFVKYINNNAKYARLMENKIQKTFPVNIVIAGYSEANLERVLKEQGVDTSNVKMPGENECIVCVEAIGLGDGEKVLNTEMPNEYSIADSEGNEVKLNVCDTIATVPEDFVSEEVGICLLVSLDEFTRISGTNIPDMVMYTMTSGSEAVLSSVFEGKDFVTLENLNKESKQLQRNRQTLQILSVIIFLIIALASLVNFLTTFMIKVRMFGKEYGVLNAIGIGMNKILKIIVYEMSMIVVPVFVLSAGLTIGITFVLNNTIQLQIYADYKVPLDLIGFTALFIVVSVGVCLAVVAKRLTSMTAVSQVKTAN